MDYFQLFDLPKSLKVDKALNLKRYYALSRQFHPDNFTLHSPAEQEEALQKSTLINSAKMMLDDSYNRLAYLLKEGNYMEEDEKYAMPADFLGEMMDINEQIMDLEFEPNEDTRQTIIQNVKTLEASIYEPVAPFFEMEILEANEDAMQKLKDYYFKKKYLNRILDNLTAKQV